MEPDLLTEALKGLIAAGPLAVVLGVAVWKLWGRMLETQAKLEKNMAEELNAYRAMAKGESRDT